MILFYLNIFQISIRCETDSVFIADNLKKDFFFYLTNPEAKTTNPRISLQVRTMAPPYERVPPLEASLFDIGLICYKSGNTRYIDYAGQALMIYDFKNEVGEIFGENEDFLYEKTKLTILSRIGELLDNQKLYRVHALTLSYENQATMCLLPMGGGKTTTILNVLRKNNEIKLTADDVSFVNPQGYVFPFVVRIGARDPHLVENISSEYVRKIEKERYGIKYLIDPAFFKDRISPPCPIKNILIGKRVFQEHTEITRIPRVKCLGPFLQSGVFGLGLPQLIEFFLRGNFGFLLSRITLFFSRFVFFLFLILRAETFEIRIGRDQTESANCLIKLIKLNDH